MKGNATICGSRKSPKKIQLFERGMQWQCPVPKQLLAFLIAGLLWPDTAGKPAPWGSEGPFPAQNQSSEG